MFSQVKQRATLKLYDIKMYLDKINTEVSSPLTEVSDFDNAIRGLFFVYLYGVYENIIKDAVYLTIECLNNSSITILDCKKELLSIVLDSEYTALYSVGNEKKWIKRWEISTRFKQNEIFFINADVFPTDGKNIKVRQLESIFNSFGFLEDVLPRQEMGGYINEMVKNRNHIAHGDKLPHDVGRGYTISDLYKRFNNVDEYCTYFIDICENYIINKKYIEVIS